MDRHCITTLACTSMLVAAGGVSAQNTEVDQLRDEVASLRAELASVRHATGENWLTDQRAEEIRGLVHDVLADADTRASLLQSGMTAGYDRGFYLGSEDGNFKLHVSGQMQFRWAYNNRDNSADDNIWSFENRRTRLAFGGHIVDPSWEYYIQGGFDNGGSGDFELLDAEITKMFDNGVYVRVGQFKAPLLREELVSSKRQLAVERSLMNEEFNQDRSQGIEVGHEDEYYRAMVMWHDGLGSRNTTAVSRDTEYAFAGRVEFLMSGNWKQFNDFTSWSDDEMGLLLGGAFNWEKAEFGTAAGPEEETFTWTIDGSAEFGGANVYAAFVGRHTDVANADEYGFIVQGGVFLVPDEWEVFARYEWGDDDGRFGASDDLSVITFGVNKYWAKHGLKWTTDVGIGINEVNGSWDSAGANWLPDAATEDGHVVIRSQLQLLF